MSGPPGDSAQLSNLLDALVDDLMSLSDENLLADAREAGADPAREAAAMRRMLDAALAAEGRGRLVRARAALDGARAGRPPSGILELPTAEKQRIVAGFAANDSRLRSRLTMAARKGEGASEREVDGILQDLRDLGAIDEDGNPR